MKKRWVVLDAEFDSLTPTRLWVIVCKDINTEERFTFRYDDGGLERFVKWSKEVNVYIGANLIGFDYGNLVRLLKGWSHDTNKIIDLQVVSRLVWFNRPGGHSVENFASKYGMVKPPITVYDDPSMIDEYVHRCEEDVEITFKMWKEFERFIRDPDWSKSLRVEHDTAWICNTRKENGFYFDVKSGKVLLKELDELYEQLSNEIISEIGDVVDSVKSYVLRRKADGSPHSNSLRHLGGVDNGFKDGEVIEVTSYRPFNPASPKDRIQFLNKCGWKPYVKTKGHRETERELSWARRKRDTAKIKVLETKMERFAELGWELCEENLETLPQDAPEAARKLVQWLTLDGRRKHLITWLGCVDPTTGRIHGTTWHIGAWTHRASHNDPNTANIFGITKDKPDPSPIELIKIKWDVLLRSCWQAAPNHLLVGTDAEGIQLRVLAHCMGDEEYAEAVANGRKEDETDVHNVNKRALGLNHITRDMAKTFIYAYLLGAGTGKVASILQSTTSMATLAQETFLERLPALKRLRREQIPADAKRGYFIGLDGRKVACNDEHLMLAGYLQNGEAVVMKHAEVLWTKEAKAEGIPFKEVGWIHDEWQSEVPIVSPLLYDDKGRPYTAEAKRLGEIQRESIRRVGIALGVLCPLAGTTDIGFNWAETH